LGEPSFRNTGKKNVAAHFFRQWADAARMLAAAAAHGQGLPGGNDGIRG
jgi:hypothetical protein